KMQIQLTMDGFMAGPNGEMDWIHMPWTDDLNTYVQEITDAMDTILLGRKLAEGFIPYWGSVAADAGNPEQLSGRVFTETQKIVFSRTMENSDWPNTKIADRELALFVNALKQTEGKDIIAYGGATFASSLLEQNLVDELYMFINPAAIGRGMSAFDGLDSMRKFQLVESRVFACGIAVLVYKPS
ncbi:MAG: hypothetical protein RL220_1395, partial [Bacteroidota bacterium]